MKNFYTVKKYKNIIIGGAIIFLILSASALITLNYVNHTKVDDIVIDKKELKNITIEDLKETKLTNADTFNNSNYPLIAEIPDHDIYLYGLNNLNYTGVVLRQGSHIQTFNWTYLTPRFILPKIRVADYDHNGADELLIILHNASGTGIAIEELHMLEPSNNELYSDVKFLPDDYINQLNSNVKYSYDKEQNKLIFNIGNNKYEMDTTNKFKTWTLKNITYGAVIYYDINDIIQITAGPEYFFKEIVSPQFFGTIKAKVNYNNEKFTLSDFELEENSIRPPR
ncbi:hypothetical protein [Desulfitobacterium sp.]|uniref:hypothetical protein n=1 Tax=Desulfitobacterium sp. TaxID=49981 RepID=UPI002B93DA68|nr:hypothetical protein [Desulfitobacterium sp.]HVJ49839.1 hypothetical protein [Desulfitobacterium sp.]